MRFKALYTSLVLLLSATSLYAQSASYTFFGSACTSGHRISPLAAVPISVSGLPRLGSSFDVITECSARYPWGNSRTVYLVTGLSDTSLGGIPLPFDISVIQPGSPYCGFLLTSMELVMRVPTQGDYLAPAAMRFTIPNNPQLLGVTVFQQVLSFEYSTFGPPFGSMGTSVAGRCTIGL